MDPFCCQNHWDSICAGEAQEDCGAFWCCTPNCWGKECGSDGCGGQCGWCPWTETCVGGKCQPYQQLDCPEVIDCMMGVPCFEPDPWFCMEQCTDGQEPPDVAVELFFCVVEACGMWNPWDDCFGFALKEKCGWLYQECMGGCEPQCWSSNGTPKECGPDGCGGVCGWCNDDEKCVNGKCMGGCEPQCWLPDGTYKECGPDGCGGVCGWCDEGVECVNGKCQGGCQPDCTIFGFPKECGTDGCGGICGVCPPGQMCDDFTFQCIEVCQPNCWGKECGDDGCGGVCGQCPPSAQCKEGQCVDEYSCLDMIECAIDCGFTMNCVMQCYGNGDQQSQAAFQQLAFCVLQNCGWDVDNYCIIKAFQGECAKQYEECAGAP